MFTLPLMLTMEVGLSRITLKDIAAKANVSLMTVSRVLNNRPDVKSDTRKKIEILVRELGYIPNSSARVLKGGNSNRIGVVVSDIKNPFYSEMVGELEDQAGNRGLSIVIADNNKRMEGEQAAIQSLLSTFVDILVIAPEGYHTDHLDDLGKKNVRFISFGVHFTRKLYPEIWIDDHTGGSLAGQHLAGLGKQKPLLLMGHPQKTTTLSRISGFQKGFEVGGGDPRCIEIVHLDVDWKESERFIYENFQKSTYDCVFCYNDLMALGAIRAFHRLRIKVGPEIPLIGYDDVSIAEVVGLTTIKIPVKEMVQALFEMIERGGEEKIKFSPSLVLRETA